MQQYFPTGYTSTYGYSNPYNGQTYPQNYIYGQNQSGQTVQNGNSMSQQMTPPTIRAEIIQVENEQAAKDYPVAAGMTQMFMSKDDKFIFIKTAFPNAPYEMVVYEKQIKMTQESSPTINTDNFVTRDEFESRINEILSKQKTYKHKNYEKYDKSANSVREDVQNG